MTRDNRQGDGGTAGSVAGPTVDKAAIQEAVRTILRAIGESPEREGLVESPRRIADMYEELFSGLRDDPMALLTTHQRFPSVGAVVCTMTVPFER